MSYRLAFCLLLCLPGVAWADGPPKPELPDSLRGFAGELAGEVTRTYESSFLLRVKDVASVWKHSKAKDPQVAVGKTLHAGFF